MINLGKEGTRNIIDYKLSRYACYLIVVDGNPNKEVIGLAWIYVEIKISFKCHKTTLFLGFVFYYIKLKKGESLWMN